MWSDLHALLPHVQNDGFPFSDLNRLSGLVRQNSPGERRHVGDRAARGIGLIFTHDPEALPRPSSLRRVTVIPKDALLLSAEGLTTSALARRALQ